MFVEYLDDASVMKNASVLYKIDWYFEKDQSNWKEANATRTSGSSGSSKCSATSEYGSSSCSQAIVCGGCTYVFLLMRM